MTEQEELELAEAEAEAAQAEPVSEPAPVPGVNDRSFTRGPTDAKTIDDEAFNTVGGSAKRVFRGLVSGVTGDLPALASRFVPDSLLENSGESAEAVREQYQNPEPGSYVVGSMMNPIAALPGSPTNVGNAAWQAAQAGFSSKARGGDNWDAAKQAAMAGGMAFLGGSLLPKLIGTASKDPAAAYKSFKENGQTIDSLERAPDLSREQGIDLMPQEPINAAYLEQQKMRSADPDSVSKAMSQDPNYIRQEVLEFNRGRDTMFDVSPVDQNNRAIANVADAEAQRAAAYDPVSSRKIATNQVIDVLENKKRQLIKDGDAERAARIETLLEGFKLAKKEQDMGRSAASLKSSTNPMQRIPAAPQKPSLSRGEASGAREPAVNVTDDFDMNNVYNQNGSPPLASGIDNPVTGPLWSAQQSAPGSDFYSRAGLPRLPGEIEPPVNAMVPGQDVFGSALPGVQKTPISIGAEQPRTALPRDNNGLPVFKEQSLPVTNPITGSRGRDIAAEAGLRSTIPGSRVTRGITEEIKLGRDAASARPSVDKSSVDPAFVESSEAFQEIARMNATSTEKAAIMEAVQRAKAAEEAAKSSTANLMGGLPEYSARGGVKSTIASTFANPLASRWRMLQQNRVIDGAIAKMNESLNPQLKALSEWISSAGSPTGVAARSFVAAKQNPEFLKMIQEGDKDE